MKKEPKAAVLPFFRKERLKEKGKSKGGWEQGSGNPKRFGEAHVHKIGKKTNLTQTSL